MVSLTMSARGLAGAPEEPRLSWSPRPETARGRPPSPHIGAGYVWAVQWIAFVSAVLQQWACG